MINVPSRKVGLTVETLREVISVQNVPLLLQLTKMSISFMASLVQQNLVCPDSHQQQ